MRKISRRATAAMMALLVTAAAFTGCGSSAEKKQQNNDQITGVKSLWNQLAQKTGDGLRRCRLVLGWWRWRWSRRFWWNLLLRRALGLLAGILHGISPERAVRLGNIAVIHGSPPGKQGSAA